LKENFDRFNFAVYKEKQMADFRKWFIALAVIALMAGAASAQVGSASPGGSAGSLFACVATAAGNPQLRPEGYTELAGDIVISCTGGQDLQVGAPIPTTNIIVFMAPAVPITSRFLETNGASEAVLIVDDAGSGLSTGATGPYGPNAPQIPCTTDEQTALGGSECPAVVGLDNSGLYEVAVSPGTTNNAPNVFQGQVGIAGPNAVEFFAVPVLPPATTGVFRTFRVTNIRVPVPGGILSGTLQAIISTNPSTILPVSGTAINIGNIGHPMTAAVVQSTETPFQQCIPANVNLTANIIFTEGFATSFKTRVVPGGDLNGTPGLNPNTLYEAEATNTNPNIQNIPGGQYGGFAQNSESGFIFPSLNGTPVSGGSNYIAGLADYGTRLKAVFTNIPSGLTMYVSTVSGGTQPDPIGGTSVLPYAVLVAINSGEANSDDSATGFTPVPSTTNGDDGLPAVAVVANASGVATAVWEVTNANPSAIDWLSFSVYISYSASSSTSTNPYGLPITTLPLGAPVNNVAMSFAPEPGGGSFSTATATSGIGPVPRFAIIQIQQGQWTTIGLCQTTLLYPFVTGASGFDTGIAVANTSWDPFGTVNQTGSCTLYGYGTTSSTTSTAVTAAQPVVSGCDQIANPLPGTNCFGGPGGSNVIPAGQVGSVLASSVFSGFTGYVIAICNFQYAHGYAAVTDLGVRNLWSSYLALELQGPSQGTPGISPRKGVSSIESLVH
jgi:hypothetical protein